MEKIPLQECVKHTFDDHYDLTMSTGPPKSLSDHWEVGEKCSHSEHVQIGQLHKISAVPTEIPTNYENRASKSVDSADAVCHKVKVRRRKLLKPRKVSGEKTQAEGDPKISRGALVSTLKPRSTQPWRTVPCRQIKKRKRSAVHLRHILSEARRGETCGHVDTKKAPPSDWTPPNKSTPVFTQPESPSVNDVISEWKKCGSPSQSQNDKGIRIAPVLPKPARLLASPNATLGTSSTGQPGEATEEPLLIHGLTVEEYQSVYHSVVDPKLLTASGNPRRHSLELGRTIKQRLWERLFCPQLREEVQADGRVKITETFGHPALFQHAPLLELDVSDEPASHHVAAERRRLKPGTHKIEDNTSEF